MKVSELEGALLDYWVAKAENFQNLVCFNSFDGGPRTRGNLPYYASDWALGGPIIEREEIGSHKGLSSTEGQEWEAWANREGNPDHDVCCTGATLLEAAMRCFVASKFGDEVDDGQTT